MKRFFTLLMALSMLVMLIACSSQEETEQFYYLRSEYLPRESGSMIAAETRTVTGERGLNYILRLYLEGPVSAEYVSPFPRGLHLLSTKQSEDMLQIFLSSEFAALEGIDLSVACACFANTVFSMTEISRFQIVCTAADGSLSIDVDKNAYILQDEYIMSSAD